MQKRKKSRVMRGRHADHFFVTETTKVVKLKERKGWRWDRSHLYPKREVLAVFNRQSFAHSCIQVLRSGSYGISNGFMTITFSLLNTFGLFLNQESNLQRQASWLHCIQKYVVLAKLWGNNCRMNNPMMHCKKRFETRWHTRWKN